MVSVQDSPKTSLAPLQRMETWAAKQQGDSSPLQDRHIVLDGYNLEMGEGTGIKTYGGSLAQTLGSLGARISILRSCRRSRIPAVQEMLFHGADPRGVSRYELLLGSLRALAGWSGRARAFVPSGLVVPQGSDQTLIRLAQQFYLAPHCYRLAQTLFRSFGRTLCLRVPEPVDIWHATYPLPIRIKGARKITTVHDLIPLRLPWATLDDKRYFYRSVRHALATSDLVLTVSECSRQDILEAFKIAPERVQVHYQPVSQRPAVLAPEIRSRLLALYGLWPQEYFLFVGALQPRKNLARLCQAVSLLHSRLPLVVAGPHGVQAAEELRQAGPLLKSKRLLLLKHVPGLHLDALYAGARFLVFPSLYEGFGLPPLEAMAHGCPVLAANTSSLPEVCGSAALYANPYDVNDLADKIEALLDDEKLRQELRQKGWSQVKRFSPEHSGRRLAELYTQVLQ